MQCKMKQIVLLLMMCFPTLLWGTEIVQNGISYSIDEEKETAEAIGYDQSSSYVTIPSTITIDGKSYAVVSIGEKAFWDNDKLQSVTIEDGVLDIKMGAFYYCRYLRSVELPSTLKSIGLWAFWKSLSLSSIYIPASLTDLSAEAFTEGGMSAYEVSPDNPVYSSEDGIMFNKEKTELLHFPAKKQMESYSIPKTVEKIGKFAFESNQLKEVTFPEKLISIDDYAFFMSDKLTKVDIPNNVSFIGESAFSRCSNLKEVHLSENLETISPGTLEYGYALEKVNIPSKVTSIGDNAFRYCRVMNSLTLPESLEEIGAEAFNGWEMTSLVIPNKVVKIGKLAFTNCTDIEKLVLGNSVSYVGDYAFSANYKLKEIDLLSEDFHSFSNAFVHCNSVEFVNLPDTDWARKLWLDLDSDCKKRYWSYETDGNGKVVKLLEIVTAIDTPNVTMDTKYKTIYDLKGNRLNHVTKGVNIVNGKKVLLK